MLESSSTPAPSLPCHPHRDVDDDSQISTVFCYQRTLFRVILYAFLVLVSAGFFFLFSWWFPKLRIGVLYRLCGVEEATDFLVITAHQREVVKVRVRETGMYGRIKTFKFQHLYYFVDKAEVWPLLFHTHLAYSEFHRKHNSGYAEDVQQYRDLYGPCKIDVPVPSVLYLLIHEILNAFFVFQMFSVALWLYEGYIYFAVAIFVISTVSLAITLIETRTNVKRVRQMAGGTFPVTVVRAGQRVVIDSWEIVHGDLLVLPERGPIPCDILLISGSCIMKESMLTGESVPVIKDPLPDREEFIYEIDKDKLYTLYQGTEVVQLGQDKEALGVVMRTGFHTLKGKLVRSILFPKPNEFKFYQESLWFVALLAVMAVIGFFITLKPMLDAEVETKSVATRSLDLITITVPPILPTAMTVGTSFALNRLRKRLIYCISPPRVNVAGEIRMMVFDKTGTLTQDGMTLMGVMCADLDHVQETKDVGEGTFMDNLVCCHSLKLAGAELVGDVMDVVIFTSTGWSFGDGGAEGVRMTMRSPSGRELRVIHLFHFDSISKRMGVIVNEGSTHRFHLKGAPEVISSLCDPSTIPVNLAEVLDEYAQKGLRVLACACGPVPEAALAGLMELQRESLERDLTFLGVVILENKLKEQSKPALEQLLQAEIKVVMATGDASLTGLAIGKECGIVPDNDEIYIGDLSTSGVIWQKHKSSSDFILASENSKPPRSPSKFRSLPISDRPLETEIGPSTTNTQYDGNILYQLQQNSSFSLVLTGKAFQDLVQRSAAGGKVDRVLLRACLERCRVYARMSPEQKTLLVEELKKTGVLVGMCGDGANDCGALKAADIGVSLSEAEASIAAPFTSKVQNISSVLDVLREGRCALATSFICFKFMALYSIIQFSSVCILYWWGSSLGDFEFLYADLVVVLPLTVLMSYTRSCGELARRTPGNSLLNVPILLSVIGSGVLCFSSQLLAWGYVSRQSWFRSLDLDDPDTEEGLVCSENSVVYLTSNFNYLTVNFLFNIGRPFRKEAYSNIPYTLWYLFLVFLALYQLLAPATWLREFMGIVDFPREFKGELLGIICAYIVAACLYEKGILVLVEKLYWRVKKDRDQRKVFADVSEELLLSFNSTIVSS